MEPDEAVDGVVTLFVEEFTMDEASWAAANKDCILADCGKLEKLKASPEKRGVVIIGDGNGAGMLSCGSGGGNVNVDTGCACGATGDCNFSQSVVFGVASDADKGLKKDLAASGEKTFY